MWTVTHVEPPEAAHETVHSLDTGPTGFQIGSGGVPALRRRLQIGGYELGDCRLCGRGRGTLEKDVEGC